MKEKKIKYFVLLVSNEDMLPAFILYVLCLSFFLLVVCIIQ